LEAACIVNKLNVYPVDPFTFILFLFVFKDVLIEVILKMLIGVVDTKLFKAVNKI